MKYIKILLILLIFCIPKASWSNGICSENCTFDGFFRENYQNLLQNLCPDIEKEKFYNTLFNAYSIKFQGLDLEYENICATIDNKCPENSRAKKKYLKSLSTIAIDEYDSFLDDISFETCGDETLENPVVKKNKQKYRKQLKKLISKNCK